MTIAESLLTEYESNVTNLHMCDLFMCGLDLHAESRETHETVDCDIEIYKFIDGSMLQIIITDDHMEAFIIKI